MNRFVAAVVPAAGLSSRMRGTHKLLLDFNRKPVLEHVLAALSASVCTEIIVVLGHQADHTGRIVRQSATLPGADCRIREVINPDYAAGMSSSIACGVNAVNAEPIGIMIALADMPLLAAADYNRLIAFYTDAYRTDPEAVAIPFNGERRGNPVIFSPRYRQDMLSNPEPDGCKGIIHRNQSRVHLLNTQTASYFTDFDTPEDFQQFATAET